MRPLSTTPFLDSRSLVLAAAAEGATSEAQILRDRAAAVLWIKSQIAKHGITYDGLLAAGCFGHSESGGPCQAAGAIRYRDATGHTWDGTGDLPNWLQRAVNAGQSIEHFEVVPES